MTQIPPKPSVDTSSARKKSERSKTKKKRPEDNKVDHRTAAERRFKYCRTVANARL